MAAAVIVPHQPHRLRRGGLVERVRNHRFHGVELLRRIVSTVAVGRVTLPLPQGMVSIHSIPPLRRVHRNLLRPIVSHRCLSPRASAPAAVLVFAAQGWFGRSKLVPSCAAGDGDHARHGLMRPIDAQDPPREPLPRDDVQTVRRAYFYHWATPRQRVLLNESDH